MIISVNANLFYIDRLAQQEVGAASQEVRWIEHVLGKILGIVLERRNSSSQERHGLLGFTSNRLENRALMLEGERFRREFGRIRVLRQGEMHFRGSLAEHSNRLEMDSRDDTAERP